MNFSGYDIIGDVHGCANTLERLLEELGYVQEAAVYRHPNRQAIFVGDIVDRGPRIREALHIVKNMVDAGKAICVMGNHEYNALGYVTPTAASEGSKNIEYVRAHNARHNRLIAETLMQFASYPEEWRMFLEWFRTLPVYLDLPSFRVVHACWDAALIKAYEKQNFPRFLDKAFIQRSSDHSTLEGRFMDRLTRGTDMPLPEGRAIQSEDGFERKMFRTKFWSVNPKKLRDIVFQPDPLPEDVAKIPLQESDKHALIYYGKKEKPVFVGHYWLQGDPKPIADNVACLDYSAVKYGKLVAYRFDGEQKLDASKFVSVDVSPEYVSES